MAALLTKNRGNLPRYSIYAFFHATSVIKSRASVSNVCAKTDEGQSMTLSAPSGYLLTSVQFASFGTPSGTCGAYQQSSCWAPSTINVVTQLCVGKSSCTIDVSTATFGRDPCFGRAKWLDVQLEATVQGASSPLSL